MLILKNSSAELFVLLIMRANYFPVVSYVTLTVPRTSTVCAQKNERVKGRNRAFHLIFEGKKLGNFFPAKVMTSVLAGDLPLFSISTSSANANEGKADARIHKSAKDEPFFSSYFTLLCCI